MIELKTDKSVAHNYKNYDLVLIGVDTHNVMGRGFLLHIARKYPDVKTAVRKTRYGDGNKLGTAIECPIEDGPTFVIAFITEGNYTPYDRDVLKYEKLEDCLKYINVMYRGKTMCCTLIGTNHYDGHGDEKRVEEMFRTHLTNLDVTIFKDRFDKPNKKLKKNVNQN